MGHFFSILNSVYQSGSESAHRRGEQMAVSQNPLLFGAPDPSRRPASSGEGVLRDMTHGRCQQMLADTSAVLRAAHWRREARVPSTRPAGRAAAQCRLQRVAVRSIWRVGGMFLLCFVLFFTEEFVLGKRIMVCWSVRAEKSYGGGNQSDVGHGVNSRRGFQKIRSTSAPLPTTVCCTSALNAKCVFC